MVSFSSLEGSSFTARNICRVGSDFSIAGSLYLLVRFFYSSQVLASLLVSFKRSKKSTAPFGGGSVASQKKEIHIFIFKNIFLFFLFSFASLYFFLFSLRIPNEFLLTNVAGTLAGCDEYVFLPKNAKTQAQNPKRTPVQCMYCKTGNKERI